MVFGCFYPPNASTVDYWYFCNFSSRNIRENIDAILVEGTHSGYGWIIQLFLQLIEKSSIRKLDSVSLREFSSNELFRHIHHGLCSVFPLICAAALQVFENHAVGEYPAVLSNHHSAVY